MPNCLNPVSELAGRTASGRCLAFGNGHHRHGSRYKLRPEQRKIVSKASQILYSKNNDFYFPHL